LNIQKASGGVNGPLISEVIDNYVNETKVNWTPKTKDEYLSILGLFVEAAGNIPIQSITRKTVGEFKQTLLKLPPNIKKNPKYRKKPISEIINMQVPEPMSDSTVRKYLARLSALFEYALRNGMYEGPNPASGMAPRKHKLPHEARAPFSKEDLVKLFHSEEYRADTHKKPSHFWMPILALFTGARLNELAQLHISDIRQAEDGVWVFDINDAGEKQLKAKASKRIIPIHPFLLNELNFLSWVEQLKAKRQQRLFPELRKERDGYGRTVSRWFNDSYRKKCGISSPDGRKRDFHSFRATFITQLVRQKVNERMRLQVEGHSPGKDMTSVYADPFPAKQLYDEVISKLDYGIDLSHLKNSRFVIKG
jgi:integrase